MSYSTVPSCSKKSLETILIAFNMLSVVCYWACTLSYTSLSMNLLVILRRLLKITPGLGLSGSSSGSGNSHWFTPSQEGDSPFIVLGVLSSSGAGWPFSFRPKQCSAYFRSSRVISDWLRLGWISGLGMRRSKQSKESVSGESGKSIWSNLRTALGEASWVVGVPDWLWDGESFCSKFMASTQPEKSRISSY